MTGVAEQSAVSGATRWAQLALGIVCMVMIANLQYGWTLFVPPMETAHGWKRADIQVAFTVFVLLETWPLPFWGLLVDRVGPRAATAGGGVLIAAGWAINGVADTLTLLYAGSAVAGLGAGLIYGTAVGNAVKWFTGRRGLAAGLTAAGFGAGSALTIVPISTMIAAYGYQATFLAFGLGQGVCVLIAALFLRRPPVAQEVAGRRAAGPDLSPAQVLRQPAFLLMYLMFVLVGAGGLMATAQLSLIAKDYGVAGVPVTLLGLTLPALTFALSIDRVLNGLTRPFFGWVSDQIGRENTMFVAFLLEAAAIGSLVLLPATPVGFVLLTGLVFFAWGEIYSLFPAASSDRFGTRHATANYGMLYTAKGTAALLVPLSSLVQATWGWVSVFYIAAGMNLAAALLALFVLKPMRTRVPASAAVVPGAAE